MPGRSSLQDCRRIDIPFLPWEEMSHALMRPIRSTAPVDPSFVGWSRAKKDGDIFIRCECGLAMGLSSHTIAADGTVTPSLFHPVGDSRDCGFHVFGRFLDWEA